jgi:ligand-binding sensor domain-containing protein
MNGKNSQKLWLSFVFFLSNTIVMSQKLSFRNYLVKDSLPSPIVCCIYQDSHGYMWIGTDKGLSRFDGVEFKTFKKNAGLMDSKINSIREDRRGYLWVGTDRGVVNCICADGAGNYSFRDIFSDRSVYSIVEDQEGKLWFGTSKGFSGFDGKTTRHFTLPDSLQTDMIITIAF